MLLKEILPMQSRIALSQTDVFNAAFSADLLYNAFTCKGDSSIIFENNL